MRRNFTERYAQGTPWRAVRAGAAAEEKGGKRQDAPHATACDCLQHAPRIAARACVTLRHRL